jgi:hypothetical protein
MAQQQKRGLGQQAPSGFNNTKHNCNNRPRRPKNPRCGNNTLVGLRNGRYAHYRHRCKSYSCGICGPKKIRQVRKRIVQLAVEHGLTRFLTLTLDPKKLRGRIGVREKILYLLDCWRKMRVYFQRLLGRSLVFVGVLELQGNGNPHLHMLIGSYVRKEWVNRAWQAVGGGSQTRIESADVHRIAAYIAGYMTEDSLCDLPKGTRRFFASRGLAIFQRSPSDGEWALLRGPIEFWRTLSAGITSEKFGQDQDGERPLISFVADRVLPQFVERFEKRGSRLGIEVGPRRRSVARDHGA